MPLALRESGFVATKLRLVNPGASNALTLFEG